MKHQVLYIDYLSAFSNTGRRYYLVRAAKKIGYPYKGLTNKELFTAMLNKEIKWNGITPVQKKSRIWFEFKGKTVSLAN